MSSNHAEFISLRPSIESGPSKQHDSSSSLIHKSASMAVALQDHRSSNFNVGQPPSHDNCDGHHDKEDSTISISSTSKHAGQTIAPFLAKHIPQQYAPLGLHAQLEHPSQENIQQKDPNTKFCYRHRPDLKCRRTADEPLMENLQRVCCLIDTTTESLLTGRRTSRRCHLQISKASRMFGRSSPPLLLNIATSCCKASSPSAASHNFHTCRLPFEISYESTLSLLSLPKSHTKFSATSIPLLCAKQLKSAKDGVVLLMMTLSGTRCVNNTLIENVRNVAGACHFWNGSD